MKNSIQNYLKVSLKKIQEMERIGASLVIGRKVEIVSPFNGQPYGSSRKSQKGKIKIVTGLHLDSGGVYLQIEGERLCIRLDEVRFL